MLGSGLVEEMAGSEVAEGVFVYYCSTYYRAEEVVWAVLYVRGCLLLVQQVEILKCR